MNRRQLLQLGILVLAGLAVRVWLFMDVGVNGDTGLYLYDAEQILSGRRIFIDFPSRSPVFEYALAAAVAVGESPIRAGRTLMMGIGLALGVAIYALTRTIHSHRAGLVAAGLFYLTPFSAVWGLWVKTEQAAALLIVPAFVISLYVIDRPRLPAWAITAVGVLFGLAFLTRMSAIVHIGAFAAFIIAYRWYHVDEWHSTLAAGAGVVATAVAVISAGYILLAGFDLELAKEIARIHGLALFNSGGQGGLGWIRIGAVESTMAESRTAWWAALCQKCGRNTIIIFMATTLAALPAFLPLLVLAQSYLKPAGFVGEVAVPVTVVVIGVSGLTTLIGTPYWDRTLGVGVLLLGVLLLWYLEPLPFARLWRPKMALPVVVLLALTAGYLYRDRILYMTYFQDFYPYIVTLGGICAVELAETDWGGERRTRVVRVLMIALLILSFLPAVSNTYPYEPDDGHGQRDWFSVQMAQDLGDTFDYRTDPGETIFAAQPLYILESDRQLAAHLSRKYYLFDGWQHTDVSDRTDHALAKQLASGQVKYVIIDKEMRTVFNGSSYIEPAVDCYYEPADSQPLDLKRLNATLLERKPNAANAIANATC